MKTLITAFLLLYIFPAFSQNTHLYKLAISERTSVTGAYREMELLRTDTQNLLIVKNRKKELLPLNEKDSVRVAAIMESYDEKLHDELRFLIDKTIVYEIDTIHISKKNKLLGIADNLFKNREKLRKQGTENKDRRIILDGTTYTITVTGDKDEPFVFYARSPSSKSHPEIHQLLAVLNNTYKTHKN